MTLQTIQYLNRLNQTFYQKVGHDFDATRQKPWAGWGRVVATTASLFSPQNTTYILDLGCGNGRFAAFLYQRFHTFPLHYTGWDTNRYLLKQAQELPFPSNWQTSWEPTDVIDQFLTQPQDLIVAFGLWHHLPGQTTRQTFLQALAKTLKPGGLAVFTTWQFSPPSLASMTTALQDLNLSSNQLEPNDYFLSWKKTPGVYRYCHLTQPAEIKQLLVKADLKLRDYWSDDEGRHSHNDYWVVSR